MNKERIARKKSMHLYNPYCEGLGDYDIHYINANKKRVITNKRDDSSQLERYVA